jgi:hypothetical protein
MTLTNPLSLTGNHGDVQQIEQQLRVKGDLF